MVEKLESRHLLCILSVVFVLFVFSVNVSCDVDYQSAVPPEVKTTTFWLSRIRQSGKNYWAKLRETMGHGHSHFFPPNIDFSGKKDDAAMGAGEKVKEAAEKSFEKSKETVEEAARSAAEVVSDAVGVVKKKAKKSVSGRETHQSKGTAEL